MATSKEYIDYVVAQVSTAGVVGTKRMFGEYGLYLDGKCVALVCDDTVYVKMLPELSTLMAEAETGFPYPGAKEHYVLSIEHRQHAIVVLQTLAPLLPFPNSAIAQSYCAVFVVSGVAEELLLMLEGIGMKPRVRRTS